MHRLTGFALCAALAASPRIADANSCNLYSPQTYGEVRVGCPLTVFALPGVDPELPEIERGGQAINPSIAQDQLTLKVMFQRYPSSDSCELITSYEHRTFDRYVLTWEDLQAGDEIELNGFPIIVPGPGECTAFVPQFYCQDGIQSCSDDYDSDPASDDIDLAGCSVSSSSGSCAPLVLTIALFGIRRRSSRRAQ